MGQAHQPRIVGKTIKCPAFYIQGSGDPSFLPSTKKRIPNGFWFLIFEMDDVAEGFWRDDNENEMTVRRQELIVGWVAVFTIPPPEGCRWNSGTRNPFFAGL